MTTPVSHACDRCAGWINEEHGLCGVCKAKEREWPTHAPIRRLLAEVDTLLALERVIARGDENDERSQWRRETYRACEGHISTILGALEELEAEHYDPREVPA